MTNTHTSAVSKNCVSCVSACVFRKKKTKQKTGNVTVMQQLINIAGNRKFSVFPQFAKLQGRPHRCSGETVKIFTSAEQTMMPHISIVRVAVVVVVVLFVMQAARFSWIKHNAVVVNNSIAANRKFVVTKRANSFKFKKERGTFVLHKDVCLNLNCR